MSGIGVVAVLVAVLGGPALSLRTRRKGELITPRPYNSPYTDATGARDPLR